MFTPKQRVVRVIRGGESQTATIEVVERTSRSGVRLVGSKVFYSPVSGREIDPPLPGWYSEIIDLED